MSRWEGSLTSSAGLARTTSLSVVGTYPTTIVMMISTMKMDRELRSVGRGVDRWARMSTNQPIKTPQPRCSASQPRYCREQLSVVGEQDDHCTRSTAHLRDAAFTGWRRHQRNRALARHVSVETTQIYLHADLSLKEQ